MSDLRAAVEGLPWEAVERAIWPEGPAHGHGSGPYAGLKAKLFALIPEDAVLVTEDRDGLYRYVHGLPFLSHYGKGEQCFPITDAILRHLREGT